MADNTRGGVVPSRTLMLLYAHEHIHVHMNMHTQIHIASHTNRNSHCLVLLELGTENLQVPSDQRHHRIAGMRSVTH